MNLRYIDFFQNESKKEIKKMYKSAFPKEERYPFCIVKQCARSSNVEFNAIYDENRLIGMEYILKYGDTIYLFYLAINKNYRNNGYGSQVLKDLIKRNKEKIIILCIDRPNNEEKIKLKRKEFYLKNNFYSTNKFTEDNGVQYEILCSNKAFEVTKEVLENLYRQMTLPVIGNFLLEKILHVYYVNFIE